MVKKSGLSCVGVGQVTLVGGSAQAHGVGSALISVPTPLRSRC